MSTWRDRKMPIFLPLMYLVNTRSPSASRFVFDVLVPLVPAIALVFFLSDLALIPSAIAVALAYLSFVSFYELGYLANDTVGTRKDETPRHRLRTRMNALDVLLFVLIRLAVWLGIAWQMGWIGTLEWIGYFAALGAVTTFHNLAENSAFKAVSFFQMSVLRFVAPIFPSVDRSHFFYLVVLAILFFTFSRFITYLDSKDRLRVPERKERWYSVFVMLIFLPFVLLSCVMARSALPLILSGYFVALYVVKAVGFPQDRTRAGRDRRDFDAKA